MTSTNGGLPAPLGVGSSVGLSYLIRLPKREFRHKGVLLAVSIAKFGDPANAGPYSFVLKQGDDPTIPAYEIRGKLHSKSNRSTGTSLVTFAAPVRGPENHLLCSGVGTTFTGFAGIYQGSSKEPDFFYRADSLPSPSIVIESDIFRFHQAYHRVLNPTATADVFGRSVTPGAGPGDILPLDLDELRDIARGEMGRMNNYVPSSFHLRTSPSQQTSLGLTISIYVGPETPKNITAMLLDHFDNGTSYDDLPDILKHLTQANPNAGRYGAAGCYDCGNVGISSPSDDPDLRVPRTVMGATPKLNVSHDGMGFRSWKYATIKAYLHMEQPMTTICLAVIEHIHEQQTEPQAQEYIMAGDDRLGDSTLAQ
ncbi:hypothetical protein CNMCM6106_003818 [Aspergillus hiratsukae]|uniref:Uncharacterized protein n=1 Tax=Aspergillus hiratsukae TaxID=1194566 RepID=A0A8H6UWJ9_9EURO|nr:hypothetical protein CNMCM6106_003818 [Aspergillus hiratsukae]